MKYLLKFICLICIFTVNLLQAQEESMVCLASTPSTPSTNGYILPSIGTVNVLMVFAQFPDDKYDTTNAIWVKGQNPASINNWIHQTWTSTPTQGTLTHYFNDMSFNNFKFTGKTVSVTSPHSRQWYLDNNKQRWEIQKEIIQQLDATWDFGEFDNWNASKNNTPDGKVDMVIFVWRSIASEYIKEDRDDIQADLDFANDYGSLGFAYPDTFSVDNGTRTINANDWGSGVTIRDFVAFGFQGRFRTVVHEVAHYLLGHNNYHNGFGFWGMLSAYGSKSIVANTFERTRLGWINPTVISAASSQTYSNVTLGDYVSTGDARILEINSSTGEYFYIENHQGTSYWESTFKFGNSIESGIYVLRKDDEAPGDGSANFKMLPAEGRYNWTVNQRTEDLWGGSELLPVFKRLAANAVDGYHDLEYVPWKWNNVDQSAAAIHFTENISGQSVLDVKYSGDGNDAFRLGYNEIFSPWSNPNSQKVNKTSTPFGFMIKSFSSGIFTLDIYVNTSLVASPAKPQGAAIQVYQNGENENPKLTWLTAGESDVTTGGYVIIERRIKSAQAYPYAWSSWSTIASISGSNNSYIDQSIATAGSGNDSVQYRFRFMDSQDLYSLYTDILNIMRSTDLDKRGYSETTVVKLFSVEQNYPNPFNPSTTIKYSIPRGENVTIKVYNLLGSEVGTVVNKFQNEGFYEVNFDARSLSSGIYVYKLTAGKYSNVKRMVLLK